MKHFALLICIIFYFSRALGMDMPIEEFRANLISLAQERKASYWSSPRPRSTIERTISLKGMLIKAEVEDGGAIILSYFDINKNLIGVMVRRFPGDDFWYRFQFFSQNLTVDYNWMFQVRNSEKMIFSPEVQWDRALFIDIQNNLYNMAKQLEIIQAQELFLQMNSSDIPMWMQRLETLSASKS